VTSSRFPVRAKLGGQPYTPCMLVRGHVDNTDFTPAAMRDRAVPKTDVLHVGHLRRI
jgi:hypothetical protein